MKRLLILLGLAVVSIALGIASVWPLPAEGLGAALVRAAAHAVLLFLAQVVFLLVLPKRLSLPKQIFVAMVAGIGVGWALPLLSDPALVTDYLGIFGQLFLLLLKLVIIPLIFVSIVTGVAGIGDVRRLGSVSARILTYYFLTTGIAVIIGLTLVNVIGPGRGMGFLQSAAQGSDSATEGMTLGMRIQQEFLPAIIQDPLMGGENPLVVIFFALLLGTALATLGKSGEPALKVFAALDAAFIRIILWVMFLAPIGVFALMARAIVNMGIGYLLTLAKYSATVLLGLLLHFTVLSCVLCPLLGRVSPKRFLWGMAPALQVAFSTSSSSATLPVTMECAAKRVGANPNVCNFTLPIGATINMDGTALYLAVASVFISQVYEMHLSFQEQFMVFLTAILVSVGTAGIPSGSIALMSIVLESARIPVAGIGIVLGVDRFLDMCRTVVNVTGDAVGAVVVSRYEPVQPAPEPLQAAIEELPDEP